MNKWLHQWFNVICNYPSVSHCVGSHAPWLQVYTGGPRRHPQQTPLFRHSRGSHAIMHLFLSSKTMQHSILQYIPRNMHTVLLWSFIMNSHEVLIHIHQGCFAGTGAIVRLPQCPWSKPDGYGKISQCITTTKLSKAKSMCIFLGIYSTHNAIVFKARYTL